MNNVPIVHYVRRDHPRGCQPAIVTSEFSEDYRPADLTVFMGGSLLYTSYVGYDSAIYVPGTWHRLSDHSEPEPAKGPRETESSSGPLDLAGRLMAVVTDAWLRAKDRTLPQLHDEALAILTLAHRQQ